jgi:lipopolysaccharide/colanic/teichoic acid biosynthesis glycosyltransferase
MGSPRQRLDRKRRAIAGSTMLFDFTHPMPVITPSDTFDLQQRARNLWRRRSAVAKRFLDVVLVTPIVLVMLPVWALCAACIRLESRGPAFFRQRRVGQHGRHFVMFKLRSMSADAETQRKDLEVHNEMPGGVLFKMRRDPRITRVGAVLRRWSLDETPQFLNVLKGDMSLVGPRPPLPEEVAAYTPEQSRRLAAKPGLTCLWQVAGRSEIPFDRQVRMDITYIRQRSLWLDLKIIAKTIPAVLSGRGAF